MRNVFVLFMCCLFFSCATTTKGDMEEHINIVDFESKLIRLQDVFGQMDSLPLFSRAEWSLGAVKSVCIDKSTLFLLDNTNAIFAFDLSTGIVKNRIQNVGHGHNEYINLTAIRVKDGKLYGLDMQGMAIYEFSDSLMFRKRHPIQLPLLDMIPVSSNGSFLAFNLNATEQVRNVALLDDKFAVRDSYMDVSFDANFMANPTSFIEDKGKIYYISPKEDELYEWTGTGFSKVFHVSIEGDKNKNIVDKTTRKIVRFFKFGDKLVVSFLHKNILHYSFYKKGKCLSGIVESNGKYPFEPICQDEASLYAVHSICKGEKSSDGRMKKEAMLFRYFLK